MIASGDDEVEALDDDALEEAELDELPPSEDDETTAHRPLPRDPSSDDVPTGRLAQRSIQRSPSRGARRRLEGATSAQEAAVHDAVVVPGWRRLFGAPLLERIPRGFRGQILDASAGTGYPSLELLPRLESTARVVAIEADAGLLDLLRRRSSSVAGKQIFARAEELSVLSFGDEVFDVVIACAFAPICQRDIRAELRRVMVPGARLLASLPLTGTFEEIVDIFREVALRRGSVALAGRVEALAARDPSADSLVRSLSETGFREVKVEVHARELVFASSHEIFTHPVIRHVALADWRATAGFEPGGDSVLAEVEETLATYVPRGPIKLTAQVGVIEAVRA